MSEENINLPQVTIQDVLSVEFNFLEKSLHNYIRLRSRESDSNSEKNENKKNNISISDNFVDTYILFVVYQFYKKRNNLRAKDISYQDNSPVIEISQGSTEYGKIIITSGMLLFYEEFIAARLFNIKKSTLNEFRELKNLKDSKKKYDDKRFEYLQKEIYRCIKKAKGLKDILIRSGKSTKSFRGILLNSMSQFYEKIPSDNKVLDMEWRKIRNLIRNMPENQNVKKAFENAFKAEGVNFVYEKIPAQPPYFYAVKINENYDSPEVLHASNVYDNLEMVKQNLPKFDENTGEFNYQDWNPYSYKKYARILKIIFRFNSENAVSMYDLKVIMAELLIDAKKIDHKYKETAIEDKTLDLLGEISDPFDLISEIEVHEELVKVFRYINNYLEHVFINTSNEIFNSIFEGYEYLLHENQENLEKVELFMIYEEKNEEIDLKEVLLKLTKIYEYLPTLEIVQSPLDILIFTSLNRMKEQKDNEN
tara:strand:- start:248 stop:1684 length:1437 start_codon:yes stop_codon:yes gene_type:complete